MLTPHIAGWTTESIDSIARIIATNIGRFWQGLVPLTVVNSELTYRVFWIFESVESLWIQLMPHNRQVRQQQKQSRRLESGDLSEGEFDLQQLFSMNIRNGTRLIKHDLPLVGYLPDRIDYHFYRMTFPLKKALSKNHWATAVLGKRNAHINDVWHELSYYNFTKGL